MGRRGFTRQEILEIRRRTLGATIIVNWPRHMVFRKRRSATSLRAELMAASGMTPLIRPHNPCPSGIPRLARSGS